MSGYRIDEQVLRTVATVLDEGGTALRAATSTVRGVVPTPLGTPELDGVAASLLANWSSGLTETTGAVTETAAGVRQCLTDYADTEQHITDLLRHNEADPATGGSG
jgi:hypothetical protein